MVKVIKESKNNKKVVKEAKANGRQVWSVMMDMEIPADMTISKELNYNGKVYRAVSDALESVGCHMAGDYMSAEVDQTDTYEANDYFEESLKESSEYDEDSESDRILFDRISNEVAGIKSLSNVPDIMSPEQDMAYGKAIELLVQVVKISSESRK